MEQYISKSAVVAEINRVLNSYDPNEITSGRYALADLRKFLDTLKEKEVDLDLVTGWFDHIAQIADDRKTLTNQRMTDAQALDEIKCLAKDSSRFITKYYKTQKGE